MRYTPVELRHVRPGRALLGYKRPEVDRVLEDVAESFEDVWRERGELTDKLEDVEKQLDGVQQRETLLASTLISAERAAAEAKDLAKREAEVIIAEAHQEARSIMRTAMTERERLFAESRRVETLLRAALGMVEETRGERPAATDLADALASPLLEWPKREDTREFQRVSEPGSQPGGDASAEGEQAAPGEAPFGGAPLGEAAQLPPVTEARPGEDDGPWAGRDFAWG
ncbi:MAG: DivIVA domain-containing protein [Actinobacteria bacterium]|nr:DivIVA domain-containing protein [Actinomycetota bacterium]